MTREDDSNLDMTLVPYVIGSFAKPKDFFTIVCTKIAPTMRLQGQFFMTFFWDKKRKNEQSSKSKIFLQ